MCKFVLYFKLAQKSNGKEITLFIKKKNEINKQTKKKRFYLLIHLWIQQYWVVLRHYKVVLSLDCANANSIARETSAHARKVHFDS